MQVNDQGLRPEIELNLDMPQDTAAPGTVFEIGDNDPMTPPGDDAQASDQPSDDSPAPTEEPTGPRIEGNELILGDTTIALDVLPDVLEKGQHFTKEMQQLRLEQREFEQSRDQQLQQFQPVIQAADFLNSMPKEHQEAAFSYLEALGNAAKNGQPPPSGVSVNPFQATPGGQPGAVNIPGLGVIDPNDLSEEGKMMYPALQYALQQNAQLAATIASMNQKLGELGSVIPEVRGAVREAMGDKEAQAVAATIKVEWGEDIAPEELRRMSKATGIADMEAAFLKLNKDRLKAGASKPAPDPTPSAKPRTPTGQAQAPVLAPGESADEYFRKVRAGIIQQSG